MQKQFNRCESNRNSVSVAQQWQLGRISAIKVFQESKPNSSSTALIKSKFKQSKITLSGLLSKFLSWRVIQLTALIMFMNRVSANKKLGMF